jgi:hypothetical protein
MSFALDAAQWAEQQFGDCLLGDARRTRRLMHVAEQVASHPAGSFPDQLRSWADLKAAYRLFAAEEVTLAAIAGPHWQRTRNVPPGCYLVLGDTTEMDFGRREVPGLSAIGNGSRNGFLLHNALLVEARTQTLVGVAGQMIHYRRSVPKGENRSQRLQRQRESHVWTDVIDQVGRPPADVQFVHVLDRGADAFEVFCHLRANGAQGVVRGCSLHRQVMTPDGQRCTVRERLPQLALSGTYELHLRARPQQPARVAKLEVRCGKIVLPLPHHKSPYLREQQPAPIEVTIVWVREVNPPGNVAPIEWVLYTTLPVESFAAAWRVIEYYECRWLIEEYHKALKTGCSVQERELRTAERLEAVVGLMSVVAVRLLQLKTLARREPDRLARTVVPALWLKMLAVARPQRRARRGALTIREFYREVAQLGGFLARKSDGEPGWITLWRGWERLHTLVAAARLLKNCG